LALASFAVVGIGNAIVDIIAHAEESFLVARGMVKGGMALIDEARAESLYASMPPAMEMSGGSAANTIAGLASLGSRVGYIGKVRDDLLGKVFRHDMIAAGVTFPTPAAAEGPATARCLILVTPDAQRTMNTFLGACVGLGPDDIDTDLIRAAEVTYLEGYLYDPPQAQQAFHLAADIAHAAGRKVALSLSDSFCVDRHRDAFHRLVGDHVDVLFANEAEITALFQTDFRTAIAAVRGLAEIVAVTRGPDGCVVVTADDVIQIPAAPVARVVDTTGAGDLFAAGFLRGLTQTRSLGDCAKLGGICAAEIISHYGARPETPLAGLVAGNI
jgi:sugar/nucleoside kinase (ribokinase family)